MSRSRMLHNIRRAVAEVRSASADLPETQPKFPGFEDTVARFQVELESVGGHFLDGRNLGQLGPLLETVLKMCGATSIYWESEQTLARHQLPYVLRNRTAFKERRLVFSAHPRPAVTLPLVLHSENYDRSSLSRVALSVSSASWGVAETGSVYNEIQGGSGRLLGVLPLNHLVLLAKDRLVSNLHDLFSRVQPASRGSSATLTTGPSQTADIEKRLVRGVHGPQRLFVLLTG